MAVSVLLGASGCAHRGGGRVDPDSPLGWLRTDPSALVARVAAVRGLPQRRHTPILFHDERGFAEIVAQKLEARPAGPPAISDSGVFYSAFGFAPPSAARGTTPEAVQREQIVAFYDETSQVVHVRDTATRAEDADGATAWIVAHEIGHALQHQYFPIPDLDALPDDDAALAALSMLEGDAMLTMLAFAASVNHVPLKRVLVNAQRAVDRGEIDEYERARGRSPALTAAPAILRERMTFPYLGGMYFMGQLYRAGGFPLVNRVYAVPPITTEQIMHVDKYLAGEGPIRVQVPGAPQGYRVLGSGRMGELQLRVTLGQCIGKAFAYTASAGWGGDAYTVVVSPRGEPALLFSSVWDAESDAREFESAARTAGRCWDAAPGPGGFPGPTLVERSGVYVAYVRGLAPPRAAEAFVSLLAPRTLAFPAKAPFGPINVPPLQTAPVLPPDVLVPGAFVSERLGIVAAVPPGFGARLESGVVLSRSAPSVAMASIGVSDLLATPEANEALFTSFIDGIRREVQGIDIGAGGTSYINTPLGAGTMRSWRLANGAAVRLILVPICGGTGALTISQVWFDAFSESELMAWLAGIRPRAAGPPPICAELDP